MERYAAGCRRRTTAALGEHPARAGAGPVAARNGTRVAGTVGGRPAAAHAADPLRRDRDRRRQRGGGRGGADPPPRPANGGGMNSTDARRLVLKALVGIGAGTVTGGSAHGFLYERHDLEVTRTALPVSGLPEALRGIRIGVLTDVHRSQTVSHEMVGHAVRTLMAEAPDVIVLGGDYVSWRDVRYIHPAAEALAPLAAPHGVIAILGNHDDDHEMPAALTARRFTVLKDARTRLTIRGENLDFAGIRFLTYKAG